MKCDNVPLVETILVGGVASSSSRMMELYFINLLLNRNWKVDFRHIPRSQNESTGQMIKCALNGGMGWISFEEPLSSVCELLLMDSTNLGRTKLLI